jgi:hypothetical protein
MHDPGDSTQRNFRYQHAYGVMLMVAAKLDLRPYVAIWCEQHEDFLAERTDGKFDGYQIKTSRPENGAWQINDGDLRKALGRFIDLVDEFGDSIGDLYFVSNTEPFNVGPLSADDRKRGLCPVLLLEHLKACKKHSEVAGAFKEPFLTMQADFGCSEERLFGVLRRVHFVVGPSRNEMDATLSHEHIAKLDDCKKLSADKLDGFRDGLINKVYQASSLQVSDPIRHLRPLFSKTEIDPALVAKRLVVTDLIVYVAVVGPQAFQFVGEPELRLGEAAQRDYELTKKPEYPLTLDEYIEKVDPHIPFKAQVNSIAKAIDNEFVINHFNSMWWTVVNVSRAPHRLLTSDRPFAMADLLKREGVLYLPISPTLLFFASNDEATAKRLAHVQAEDIVQQVNAITVGRARRFVYAHDESQTRFVTNRMSSHMEKTPLMPELSTYPPRPLPVPYTPTPTLHR